MDKPQPTTFFGLKPPDCNTTPCGNLLIGPDGCVVAPPDMAAREKYRRSLTEETCCSFEEWKSCGYWINKGSKSVFTDPLGVPQFTKEQVTKSRW
jgi:hypothetical protein